MKYFKKLVGDRIYLSPRNSEDVEKFTEWLNDFETTDSLEDINWINRTATLGIFIGDKEFRSKGYGTEAIRLILEYGFKYMNLYNIKLDLMEFNERALKCYEKCGFKEYGRRRKCKFVNGKYYDSISMDILADEFTGDFIKNKNI